MKNIDSVKTMVNNSKLQVTNLKNEIYSLSETDNTAKFYLNNLKKLTLQAIDLFVAMDKQINFLQNQKKLLAVKNLQQARSMKRG